MILAIDFDGTCVKHEYPEVGGDIGAVPVLKKLVDRGHKLILWTMRSGKELQDAVDWFQQNELPLFGIQEHPTQHTWTTSRKCYANLYIDDAGLGIPLKQDRIKDVGTHPIKYYDDGRPYVDWSMTELLLISMEVL